MSELGVPMTLFHTPKNPLIHHIPNQDTSQQSKQRGSHTISQGRVSVTMATNSDREVVQLCIQSRKGHQSQFTLTYHKIWSTYIVVENPLDAQLKPDNKMSTMPKAQTVVAYL